MIRIRFCFFILLVFGAMRTTAANAWWARGHKVLSEAAVLSLPSTMPQFFREGGGIIAVYSLDPDIWKNRDTPHLKNAEGPEHFIDCELLPFKSLPPTRYEYLKRCYAAGVEPNKIGTLPYSIAENIERLTISFAQYRKQPNDVAIQYKCLMEAGQLAHYAEDLCQPLHVTVDFDGRTKNGISPRSGIHDRVDALIGTLHLTPRELMQPQRVRVLTPLLPAITAQIADSQSLIDVLYLMEKNIPPAIAGVLSQQVAPEVQAFAQERGRAAAALTASAIWTAWVDSAKIKLRE